MSKRKNTHLALIFTALFAVQGCAVLVVGAGVGAVSAAHDRRSLGSQLDDKTAAGRLATTLANDTTINEQANINVHVFNGTALLVGQVPTEQLMRQAHQLAESVKNIKKLHNQIRIARPISAGTNTHDVWLASKIKAKLIADNRIDGLYVDVAVEDSEVFLMGLVSQQEATISVEIARNVEGVKQVIKVFEYL